MSLENRFWSKVEKTDTCWNWTACKTSAGYGQICINKKRIYSHRFSYELYKGEIPQGLDLDHLCRNRKCVNPEHLEAVNRKENCIRGECGKHNQNKDKTHCIRGHKLSGNNLYLYKNGHRMCKTCNQEHHKRYNQYV